MSVTQAETKSGLADLAGTWEFDPDHTRLGFSVRHMMVSTVRGSFGQVAGTAEIDPTNPAASIASVTIEANSIETGSPDRDAHLRSTDFFEIEKHPTIEFRSTEIRPTNDPHAWKLVGELTIRGVTRPVELDITYLGLSGDPWGGTRAGFEGTGKINRKDWGLNWNAALEAGGVLVGDQIKLELDIQAVKKS